jgi:GT2 family glycosyltransferase
VNGAVSRTAEASAWTASDVAVVIPTYGRDEVLTDTIRMCLDDPHPPGEILVCDQTSEHNAVARQLLTDWSQAGRIRWERLARPSQPAAMNHALRVAAKPLLLFLDDDIIPAPGFIQVHAETLRDPTIGISVGQVVQPWQQPEPAAPLGARSGLRADLEFPFHSTLPTDVGNVMSGHMALRRDEAVALGGFDENFLGAAYRFDTEYGRRVQRTGQRIRFNPAASIRHLRAERGGTRVAGGHLTSASPHHGVGDYYFALKEGRGGEGLRYCLRRMFREVRTKFHVTHPWWIPVKLLGEARGWLLAWRLLRRGPALLSPEVGQAG